MKLWTRLFVFFFFFLLRIQTTDFITRHNVRIFVTLSTNFIIINNEKITLKHFSSGWPPAKWFSFFSLWEYLEEEKNNISIDRIPSENWSVNTSHGSPGDNFLISLGSGGTRTRFSEYGIFSGEKQLKREQTLKLICF